MKQIPNITPRFYGYDNYPRDDDGKILLDRAEDGKIVIKRRNTISIGGKGLLALCDGSKISLTDWQDLRRGFWLEDADGRMKYHYCVGGSDAGAILGASPYSTAQDIYNAKKSMKQEVISDETDYMFEYGHKNEPLVAQGFANRTKLTVFKNDCVFFNESTGFMQANVDYFVKHPNGTLSILEIKTTNPNSSTFSLAKDQKKVPPTYYAQAVLHYPMALSTGFNIVGTYFAIACDNSLNNIQFCHFERDIKNEQVLLQAEKDFVDCLNNEVPPKDTTDPSVWLEKSGLKQTEAQPVAVDLDDTAKAAVDELEQLYKEEKRISDMLSPIKKRKEELQAIICKQIGDASSSTTYLKNKKYYTIHWNSYTRKTIDKTVLENKYPDAFADSVRNSVSRKFSISVKEEK